MVAVSSKVVSAWAIAVRTLGWWGSPYWREKEHYWYHPVQGQLAISTDQGTVWRVV